MFEKSALSTGVLCSLRLDVLLSKKKWWWNAVLARVHEYNIWWTDEKVVLSKKGTFSGRWGINQHFSSVHYVIDL